MGHQLVRVGVERGLLRSNPRTVDVIGLTKTRLSRPNDADVSLKVDELFFFPTSRCLAPSFFFAGKFQMSSQTSPL